jgi:hypothetical protein
MMLRDIMATQCADRQVHALVAGSSNSEEYYLLGYNAGWNNHLCENLRSSVVQILWAGSSARNSVGKMFIYQSVVKPVLCIFPLFNVLFGLHVAGYLSRYGDLATG